MGEAKRRKQLDPTFGKERRVVSRKPTELLDGPDYNYDYRLPSGFSMPIVKGQFPIDAFSRTGFDVNLFCADYLYLKEFFSVIREACLQPVENRPIFYTIWQAAAARATEDENADPLTVHWVDDFPDSVGNFSESLSWIAEAQDYQMPLTDIQFESCFWDVMAFAINADEDYDTETVKTQSLGFFLDSHKYEKGKA